MPSSSLGAVHESDIVVLRAVFSIGGAQTDVTSAATWTVFGPIGMVSAGVFKASLAASVSEFGEGYGAVTAIYQDTSGASHFATTPVFKVSVPAPAENDNLPG